MSFNLTNETFVPTLSPTEFPISNITTNGDSSQSDYSILISLSIVGGVILSAATVGVYYGFRKYYKNLNHDIDININALKLPGEPVNPHVDDTEWSE